MPIDIAKAHAYGNDFLYVKVAGWDSRDWASTAREMCQRQTGLGADGLILYQAGSPRPRMRLLNADGSPAEISGNGVRGLAALLSWQAVQEGLDAPKEWVIDTDAGAKRLTLLSYDGTRFTFRAAMGEPTDIQQMTLDVGGERVGVVTLRVGNPQCVVLEAVLDDERYRRLGPLLERHQAFPQGTNVSFARVAGPDRVDILIWERGVGPTLASGTGACGAAVAAMTYGGCTREVDVVAPGGVQRVAWTSAGIELTGWAAVVWTGQWLG
ncbi:MAG: diaminopimelate epimerase [Acidobacteria bacterium]|nr:diaminopimelate epimerase [Acidobacteriota bacterium]